MALTFVVDASLSGSISGLSWKTIFDGTFPDRRFLRLEAHPGDDDKVLLVQACSPALEEAFRWKSLRHKSPGLYRRLKKAMPLLLDIYDDEEDDDGPSDRENEGEEPLEFKEDEIYPEDVSTVLELLLGVASEAPHTALGETTIGAVFDEIQALHVLCFIASESVYGMRWRRS